MKFYLSDRFQGLLVSPAMSGDLEEVRDLLKRGANVNAKSNDGYTALIHACLLSHSNVALEILKQNKVDVNAKEVLIGRTALIWASIQGLSDVALEILKRDKVDVYCKDIIGRTSLTWACRCSHPDIALEILKQDYVSVNATDCDGRTALIWACYKGLSDVALEILKRDNVNVNAIDCDGRTALILACGKGLSDVKLEILKRDDAKESNCLTDHCWTRIYAATNVSPEVLNETMGLPALPVPWILIFVQVLGCLACLWWSTPAILMVAVPVSFRAENVYLTWRLRS